MANEVYLNHSGAEIDACIDDVDAAKGTSASLAAAMTAESTARADADAALQTAVDDKASVSDIFGTGTPLRTGDNLNDMTALGTYNANTAAIAGALVNSPSARPFRMEVTTFNGSTRFLQKIIDANTTTNVVTVYIRAYTSSGWTSWNKFEGTVVS